MVRVQAVVGRMKSVKLTSQLKSQAERIQGNNTLPQYRHTQFTIDNTEQKYNKVKC